MKAGGVVAALVGVGLVVGAVALLAGGRSSSRKVEAGHRYRFFAFVAPALGALEAAGVQTALEQQAENVNVSQASDRTQFAFDQVAQESFSLPRETQMGPLRFVVTAAEELS